ncbi:MAG: response regulator [Austwickia sp.]|nr:response regulator [Actinomycetota bacterium]MCB1301271.1 response regulator [Tetrasphaera sp.]MCO5307752.1 response regulator [Austwickia sp.]
MKVVVADDSRAMRMIVVRTLRQAGYDGADIIECEDGAEGLAAVKANSPDMVLSDWNMPNMSGIEFLQALRADGNQVPFGFVTSEGSDAMRSQASEHGALFLIAKPFTADMFSEALKPVLG